MFASEEINMKVVRALANVLNIDEDYLTPKAALQGNLGADSLDLIDIVFRLEREFEIEIPVGELFPESVFEGDAEFVRDGRVTDQGMGELRSRMPYADLGAFDKDRRLNAVADLFTVDMVVRYMTWKLSQGVGACLEVAGNMQGIGTSSPVHQG
jgi:acyl carrier protein